MKAIIVTLLTFIFLLIIFYIRIKEPFDVNEIKGHINYLNYLCKDLDNSVASFP